MEKMLKGYKCLIIVGLLFLLPALLSAQTASELEAVRKAPVVTCAQAVRFVAASAGSDASAGSENNFEQALAKGWLPKSAKPNDNLTLGKLSLIVTKAFNIKGGLMYLIFPSRRYAFRTMVSRSYIQSPADPSMKVSGERFLQILDRVLSGEGED